MQVQTLVSIAAEAIAQEKVALGHLAQVELMQELAGFALLAETSEPMFTDERVERVATAALLFRGVVGGR